MVLIEYAVVNIILGDGSGDAAKGPAKPEPKPSKATDLAIKVKEEEESDLTPSLLRRISNMTFGCD
ncbi:hypothetical protein E2C01_102308 [Portunus trituberculatus]|uniref:Uncharacterized protein n=1 Tax=Portunus trituberculatus TaxID=210409 RepID=A0A5B7KI15_PORTR|nr:hypothetical protein [Portunus trituberculatus]